MLYFEVAVGNSSRGDKYIFTYSSPIKINKGSVVVVDFRGKDHFGFIVKKVTKPVFNTLPIKEISSYSIPPTLQKALSELAQKYPFSGQLLTRLFLPSSIKRYETKSGDKISTTEMPELNTDQKIIVDSIIKMSGNALLFGDTGTGKTRMYCHIINSVLKANKNALLLEPEIGLASYIHKEISEIFPNVVLYHSTMTPKERQLAWQKVHDTESGLVVIGPRSALTLPIKNLGVIITDEAHDAAYRQENSPYIYAQTIISSIVHSTPGCFYIYGSATPNVTDHYFAGEIGIPIYRLKTPAMGGKQTKPPVTISPRETTEIQSGKLLLKTSIEVLRETFKQGGQAMILINRRGTARLVRCEECGHELSCPNCGHLYVYHHDTHRLHCHFCTSRTAIPTSCPECNHSPLSMIPFGTKALELEISKLFPAIAARRFDTDTSKEDHLSRYTSQLENGEIQCIIGTQMIAKGLDLPKLKTLVVIEGANGSGYMNEERQFQLLYQVVGRAHRGHQDANIIIQSENHLSPIIANVLARDYESFYRSELSERKAFRYPPFCHMMVIHYQRKSSKSAQTAGNNIVNSIKSEFPGIEILEPVANLSEKLRDTYSWHIVVKSPRRKTLQSVAEHIGSSWLCEFDPITTP